MRDILKMNEIIPGELWFEIARRDFLLWWVLTKTIRVFWLHVRKIGRERILEKLFGSIEVVDHARVMWFISFVQHRFGGLPFEIDLYNSTWWYPKDRSVRRNPSIIDDSCMRFIESSRGVRKISYDGNYVTDTASDAMAIDSDGFSTISIRAKITLQDIYFKPRTHRYAIQYIENDGTLRYFDSAELRDQNLPRFLGRDGLFLSNM